MDLSQPSSRPVSVNWLLPPIKMSQNNAGDQAARVNHGDKYGPRRRSLEHGSGCRYRPGTRWTLNRQGVGEVLVALMRGAGGVRVAGG
jgi:hypothetical protein